MSDDHDQVHNPYDIVPTDGDSYERDEIPLSIKKGDSSFPRGHGPMTISAAATTLYCNPATRYRCRCDLIRINGGTQAHRTVLP